MATSLGDLLTLVEQRSNQENNNQFSEEEKITYINNSLAELYDIMTDNYEDYDSHTFTSILTGSNNFIPILSDVNKIRLVEFKFMSGSANFGGIDNFYPINQFQMPQRNRYGNTPLNVFLPYSIAQLTWRAMGGNIIIEPIASCQGEYKVWYSQKWQNLVNLTDTLPVTMDSQAWSEYAVVDACIKMLTKFNIETSGFERQKAELKDRIISATKNRTTSPKCMVNIRRRNKFGIGQWGPGGMW